MTETTSSPTGQAETEREALMMRLRDAATAAMNSVARRAERPGGGRREVEACAALTEAMNAVEVALATAAPALKTGKSVYLVATGETHAGFETYTRHEDAPPPLCDFERLYTTASKPAAVVSDERIRCLWFDAFFADMPLAPAGAATDIAMRMLGLMSPEECEERVRPYRDRLLAGRNAALAESGAPATHDEIHRLRAAQAEAVMPMIGPLLDAWECCSQAASEGCPELHQKLKAINRAMETAGDETRATHEARAGGEQEVRAVASQGYNPARENDEWREWYESRRQKGDRSKAELSLGAWLERARRDSPTQHPLPSGGRVEPVACAALTDERIREGFRGYDMSIGAKGQTAWQIWRDAVSWAWTVATQPQAGNEREPK